MDMKKTITHLIKAGRDAMHLDSTLGNIGYDGTPYFNLYGDICEALYAMLGEDTDSFEQSETYAVMHDCLMPDEMCADQLLPLYFKNACDLSDHTVSTLEEAAEDHGISIEQMIRLVISEWAMRQNMLKALI